MQWCIAAAVVAAVGCHGALVHAAEGEAYVLADVQCSPEVQGVLDLTLVNDRSADATFVLLLPGADAPSTIVVAPAEAYAVTYTGLADGPVLVPITLDGADATAAAVVSCDSVRVESRAGAPRVAGAVADGQPQLPATGSSKGGLMIGSLMVAAGSAASLLSRRRVS